MRKYKMVINNEYRYEYNNCYSYAMQITSTELQDPYPGVLGVDLVDISGANYSAMINNKFTIRSLHNEVKKDCTRHNITIIESFYNYDKLPKFNTNDEIIIAYLSFFDMYNFHFARMFGGTITEKSGFTNEYFVSYEIQRFKPDLYFAFAIKIKREMI